MADEQLSPDELRRYYLAGTLNQRYHIAWQRIEHPDLGPSLLVNVMSALEGVGTHHLWTFS